MGYCAKMDSRAFKQTECSRYETESERNWVFKTKTKTHLPLAFAGMILACGLQNFCTVLLMAANSHHHPSPPCRSEPTCFIRVTKYALRRIFVAETLKLDSGLLS